MLVVSIHPYKVIRSKPSSHAWAAIVDMIEKGHTPVEVQKSGHVAVRCHQLTNLSQEDIAILSGIDGYLLAAGSTLDVETPSDRRV